MPRLDPQEVRLGKQVYRQECARCHGAAGEGAPDWKNPGEDGRYPPPPHDSTGHTWHHADGLLYRIIARGGTGSPAPNPASTPSGMPAFGERLSPQQIRAVISYLKTWWEPRQREFQAEVSEEDPMPLPASSASSRATPPQAAIFRHDSAHRRQISAQNPPGGHFERRAAEDSRGVLEIQKT